MRPAFGTRLARRHFLATAGVAIAEAICYETPNAAAKALLPASYPGNPGIFPSAETLAACEPSLYRGPEAARLYEAAWIRAA